MTPTIEFSVPDVPYSKVTVEVDFVLNENGGSDEAAMQLAAENAALLARLVRNAFLLEFPAPEPPPVQERPAQGRQQAPARPQGGRGAIAYCPEHHGAPCQLSKPEYNRDGDRLWHPLDERDQYRDKDMRLVKNHSLYWRQTVDANGESNEGRAIPQPSRSRQQTDDYGDVEPF